MSGSLFRNDNDAVGLAMGVVLQERFWRRAGNNPAAHVEPPIVTRTPDDGLARLISHRATFMRALGAEREQLLVRRLQHDDALAAHRDDDELVLLELAGLFASEMRGPGRAGLWQWLEITNDRVGEANEPAERARA